MPNLWTHICFCENIVDAVSKPNTFIKQEAMMKLGAQGLRLFHLNKQKPFVHDHAYSKGFLTDLITSAKNKNKYAQAYVFGFMTHYILEQHIHAFVHAWGGQNQVEQDKFKINMDTVLMKKNHNLETWKVPVHKEIDVGLFINKEVAQLLFETWNAHFSTQPIQSPRYIQSRYFQLKWKLIASNDPCGWKNVLLNKWMTPYSSHAVEDNVDYLNMQKRPWEDMQKQVIKTDSFDDLYEQARLKAIDILTEVTSYWKSSDKSRETKVSQYVEKNLTRTSNERQLNYP